MVPDVVLDVAAKFDSLRDLQATLKELSASFELTERAGDQAADEIDDVGDEASQTAAQASAAAASMGAFQSSIAGVGEASKDTNSKLDPRAYEELERVIDNVNGPLRELDSNLFELDSTSRTVRRNLSDFDLNLDEEYRADRIQEISEDMRDLADSQKLVRNTSISPEDIDDVFPGSGEATARGNAIELFDPDDMGDLTSASLHRYGRFDLDYMSKRALDKTLKGEEGEYGDIKGTLEDFLSDSLFQDTIKSNNFADAIAEATAGTRLDELDSERMYELMARRTPPEALSSVDKAEKRRLRRKDITSIADMREYTFDQLTSVISAESAHEAVNQHLDEIFNEEDVRNMLESEIIESYRKKSTFFRNIPALDSQQAEALQEIGFKTPAHLDDVNKVDKAHIKSTLDLDSLSETEELIERIQNQSNTEPGLREIVNTMMQDDELGNALKSAYTDEGTLRQMDPSGAMRGLRKIFAADGDGSSASSLQLFLDAFGKELFTEKGSYTPTRILNAYEDEYDGNKNDPENIRTILRQFSYSGGRSFSDIEVEVLADSIKDLRDKGIPIAQETIQAELLERRMLYDDSRATSSAISDTIGKLNTRRDEAHIASLTQIEEFQEKFAEKLQKEFMDRDAVDFGKEGSEVIADELTRNLESEFKNRATLGDLSDLTDDDLKRILTKTNTDSDTEIDGQLVQVARIFEETLDTAQDTYRRRASGAATMLDKDEGLSDRSYGVEAYERIAERTRNAKQAIMARTPGSARIRTTFDNLGLGSSEEVDRMAQVRNTLGKILPTKGSVRSFSLGPINIGLGNMKLLIRTISELVMNVGSLVTVLGGVTTAGAAAGGALAGFVATGAVGYFDQLAASASDVEDRGEAIEVTFSAIKDLALEALEPLQNARLGGEGGQTSIEAFIGTVKGGLNVLRTFARLGRDIVEMDVVADSIERVNASFDSSEFDALSGSLRNSVQELLPFVTDGLTFMIDAFPDLINFMTMISSRLGPELATTFRYLVEIASVLIPLGAGRLKGLLQAINFFLGLAVGTINALEGVVGVVNEIFGTDFELRGLLMTVGYLSSFVGLIAKLAKFTGISKVVGAIKAVRNTSLSLSKLSALSLSGVATAVSSIAGGVLVIGGAVSALSGFYAMWKKLPELTKHFHEKLTMLADQLYENTGLEMFKKAYEWLQGMRKEIEKLRTSREVINFLMDVNDGDYGDPMSPGPSSSSSNGGSGGNMSVTVNDKSGNPSQTASLVESTLGHMMSRSGGR